MQPQPTSAPVVHELHTVIRERDAGRTLTLVLAAAAVLIAAGGAAYSRQRIGSIAR